ncbi:DUF3108 domain-containing protein, partial [Rugamonas sp. FT103W]|nr:DUF3108 domain-containing protein [Rugamonas rivuli]
MSLSTHLFQRRRLLLLCAATLALHYLAIDWVGGRLAAQTHRPSPLPPSLMTAQLRLALPKHVDTPPAAELQPLPAAAKPAPKPRPKPAPQPAAEPAPPAAEPPA